MKHLEGAILLGLLPMTSLAQSVVTVSIPTCLPGGGSGAPAGTGPQTEVFDITTTDSLGSRTVESITEVITPSISPSTFVTDITTTNSLGSITVETSTGTTVAVQSTTPNTFVTEISTTDSLGSSVVETSTGTSPATSAVQPTSPAETGPATTPVIVSSNAGSGGPSPSATSTAGTLSCPASDGSSFTDAAGNVYIVQCTADYPGNDLKSSLQSSLEDCINYCDTLTGCIGVTYGAPSACYPKYAITGTDYNYGNYDSAYRANYDYAPQSVTTFGTGGNAPTSAAPIEGTTASTGGLTTPAGVTTAATNTPTAAGPGTVSNVDTATGAGAGTGTGSPAPIQTIGGTPACPDNNGDYFDTVFSNTYNITCGLDLVGNNADEVMHADTYVDCLEACDLLVGCVAVTFTGVANPTSLNCYPYYLVTGTKSAGTGSTLFAGVNVNGPNTGASTPDEYCGADPTNVNQTVINDFFGNNYKIGCGQTILSPTPLVSVDTTNFEACIYYCSICETCVAVTYTGTHTAGVHGSANCYTFSANGTIAYQGNVNYAVRET